MLPPASTSRTPHKTPWPSPMSPSVQGYGSVAAVGSVQGELARAKRREIFGVTKRPACCCCSRVPILVLRFLRGGRSGIGRRVWPDAYGVPETHDPGSDRSAMT